MQTSFFFTLLAAAGVMAMPNAIHARDTTSTPTSSATPTSTTAEYCPTAPASCTERDGDLFCLPGEGVWCVYKDPMYGTPAFFPVNMTLPCPACIPEW
ncbi:hypothetical protein F4780DRAFT_385985 [Xylariomycetidae sp. FL0641]|nr:hypothetical protein F4780DRAFT_385985 [Xylariomycetidae sp. FL0641]